MDPDYPLTPDTHPPMYLMHKYWARKPYNIVGHYIQKYCPPNGIVLDPFLGSGVTVIESVINGRNAIGYDLNPMSIFITENTISKVDLNALKVAFAYLENVIAKNPIYNSLFHLDCPYCLERAYLTHIIWHKAGLSNVDTSQKNSEKMFQNQLNEKIAEIRFECSGCKQKFFKVPEKGDSINVKQREIIQNILSLEKNALKHLNAQNLVPPSFKFEYSNKKKFLQLRHDLRTNASLNQLFTNRNLAFLTFLQNQILKIEDLSLQNAFLFILSASLAQASKMVWVIDKRKGKNLTIQQVGSWTHHFFWNPHQFFEVNAWECFKQRYTKYIRGKKNLIKRLEKKAVNFIQDAPINALSIHNLKQKSLENGPFLLLHNKPSQMITLPNNSVDFVFTDPPYGDSIQYGELSSFWVPWVIFPKKTDIGYSQQQKDYEKNLEVSEITINTHQAKDLPHYQGELEKVFQEIFRVLKPECFLMITFHNTLAEVRNALLRSVINQGFQLEQIIFQLPPRASLKSILHHKGSPIGDYYIRFLKPKLSETNPTNEISLDYEQKKEKVAQILQKILLERGEPTAQIWINNLIDEALLKEKILDFSDLDQIFLDLSKSPLFQLDDDGWWLRDTSSFNCKPPLYNRISQEIANIISNENTRVSLKSNNKTKKQLIFNQIYQKFNGILTPDKFTVNKIIESLVKE